MSEKYTFEEMVEKYTFEEIAEKRKKVKYLLKDVGLIGSRYKEIDFDEIELIDHELELMLAAVKNDGLVLEFISERIADGDVELDNSQIFHVVATAVHQNGRALEFAKKLDLDLDLIICQIAIRQNPDSWVHSRRQCCYCDADDCSRQADKTGVDHMVDTYEEALKLLKDPNAHELFWSVCPSLLRDYDNLDRLHTRAARKFERLKKDYESAWGRVY